MASFEYVNYYLRTNKNIERKIIFESLDLLDEFFSLKNYRYLGFGGLWFVDFLLAHKMIGISDMISIEKDRIGFLRARFNKPFGCIEIKEGESNDVIPMLSLADKPLIAWLDYDGDLVGSSALEDVALLCSTVKSGSILLVTLNAHVGQLNSLIEPVENVIELIAELVDDDRVSDSENLQMIRRVVEDVRVSRTKNREAALRVLGGDFLPDSVPKQYLQKSGFPAALAAIIIESIRHSLLSSGRMERFYPLFNFSYKDNAPMITVGGMIADNADAIKIQNSHIRRKSHITGEKPYEIKVPPLTVREKLALDQLLPRKSNLTSGLVERKYNFQLYDEQLLAYRRFYTYYPLFGEFDY